MQTQHAQEKQLKTKTNNNDTTHKHTRKYTHIKKGDDTTQNTLRTSNNKQHQHKTNR